MDKCLSKKLILPSLMPFEMDLPTWWGDRRLIMSSLAHRSSVSAPDEAPTKSSYRNCPWRLFFSTWSAKNVGVFLIPRSVQGILVKRSGNGLLGVPDTRETRPSDRGTIGKVVKHVFWAAELLEERGSLNAALDGLGCHERRHNCCHHNCLQVEARSRRQ